MKIKFWLVILISLTVLFSGQALAKTAMDDLEGVIEDPAYFDGGPGSTLNE